MDQFAVIRDGVPDHRAEMSGLQAGQVNEGVTHRLRALALPPLVLRCGRFGVRSLCLVERQAGGTEHFVANLAGFRMHFADRSATVGALASCNILAVVSEHVRQIVDGNDLAACHP
jgi:hypothetical protein